MNKEKLISILKYVAAVIVILSMFVIIFYQNRDRDIFKFGKEESSQIIAANQENLSGDAFAKSDVQRIGDKVAFLTPASFSVMDKNTEGESETIAYSKPCFYADGKFAVIYDEGTTKATVYKMDRQSYSVATENKIIKAKVNSNGYMIVATEKEGYTCECIVYNKNGEAIFKWDMSSSEFLDGAVSINNNVIVLSVATAKDEKLYGELITIDITTAKVLKKHSVQSQLFYCIKMYKNDTYSAVSNKSLVYFNSDGSQKWKYDFGERVLIKADMTEPDMMVLAFMPEGSVVQGSSTDVKIVNRIGKVVAEKNYVGNIEDIAMGDTAVAMAFGKKVIIADNNLKDKKTLESDSVIKKIALFSSEKEVFAIGNSDSKILK